MYIGPKGVRSGRISTSQRRGYDVEVPGPKGSEIGAREGLQLLDLEVAALLQELLHHASATWPAT